MSDRILVMSERPGRIVEEIPVDLPDRDNPHGAHLGAARARICRSSAGEPSPAGEGGMTSVRPHHRGRTQRPPASHWRRAAARRGAGCAGIRRTAPSRRARIAAVDPVGKPRLRHRVPARLAVPAAGARRAVLHHSDRHRSRARVRPHGRAREPVWSTSSRPRPSPPPASSIGSLLGAAHGLRARDVGVHREGAVALPPRPADRAQGGVCAAVHHVARLQRLAEAARHRPGGVLPDPGERAAVDEDGRPRPDQSGARLQHEPAADLLEDRGAGLDAGADGGSAHRRDAWR